MIETMKNTKKTVLVCDDDPGVLEVVKVILENNGYVVQVLTSGKGIKKKILKTKPGLLLLDVWMPGIDGREVTLILKKDPETKDLPIVIISALNDTEEIASEYGADGYVAKPFDMERLLEVVGRFFV